MQRAIAVATLVLLSESVASAQLAGSLPTLLAPDGGGASQRGRTISRELPWLEDASRFALLSYAYGPQHGVIRRAVDARVGVFAPSLGGRLSTTLAVRANVFVPDELRDAGLEPTHVLMLEGIAALDLRDDPERTREGVYLRLAVQAAGLGLSSWDYLRVTGEARAYLPLAFGVVLAARVALGAMLVLESHGLDPAGIHDLDELGPISEQLQAGGVRWNRGYPRGGLGAVRRSAGSHSTIVGGGTRRWAGSLELRIPLPDALRAVLFVDVGNITRHHFDFAALNLAAGFGLRYRTRIGVLHLEWAFRPDALQDLGERGRPGAPRPCGDEQDVECRPVPLLFGRVPGQVHLGFGEAF